MRALETIYTRLIRAGYPAGLLSAIIHNAERKVLKQPHSEAAILRDLRRLAYWTKRNQ